MIYRQDAGDGKELLVPRRSRTLLSLAGGARPQMATLQLAGHIERRPKTHYFSSIFRGVNVEAKLASALTCHQ
jgi:hypothetical protein